MHTIDRPDLVNLVKPPIATIPKTKPAHVRSQRPTFALTSGVLGSNAFGNGFT